MGGFRVQGVWHLFLDDGDEGEGLEKLLEHQEHRPVHLVHHLSMTPGF